ncbi:ABC transporter ATP-binding protein [Spiroplasma culicicola]|uniref:ABC transporter ATP-binding protein/permease n=1 Tax=Spiroplasma culicicola AES-1 TaxID=1276246 RepID=W6A6C1_9MOLU|nr:ABC transporter ATP-binding protein [Spiroplasma culicicola]AHI52390.1 ABC transporter ATP-binding protein/permease [Spiroplasma culicicola AES-1]
MNNSQDFITKSKRKLFNHLLTALRDRWFLSSLMFLITVTMAIVLMINIKAIEYVTALLISKSLSDAFLTLDADQIITAYPELAPFREIIVQIITNLNDPASEQYIEQFLQTFFYDYVHYSEGIVYVILFNQHLNLYSLVTIMIIDISIVVVLAYFVYIISGFIASSYEQKLRVNLIAKLIDQDLHYFSENKTGELISALIKESQVLSRYIKEAPVNYCLSITTIIVSSIMMFSIDWKLALYVFGLLIICLFLVYLFTLITIKSTKNTEKLNTIVNNDLNEKVYSMRLIKASGTYQEEKEQFNKALKNVATKNKQKLFISEIPGALIVGGIGSFSMASVIFGVILYYNDTQSLISILTAFTTGVIVMVMPILQLRQVIANQPLATESAKNISKILESKITINKHETKIFDEKVKSIEFQDASFAYPNSDKVILNKLSLKLEVGKKYAFVGPTGSGKSTIAKLLLRFYDLTTGNICINNQFDLKQLNLKSWLDTIGYVDQEPQILSGTVMNNIKYGLENATNEQAIEAAKKAKLHDLIMTWPDGYDTILFERGSQLSGGQKQRLVIARLILKDPQILILDEATSALDNIVEKEIQMELEKLMIGRTTISIAHRLSTIKSFDKIFVLEPNVGIIQSGTYEQLIKTPGLFKTLYEISK